MVYTVRRGRVIGSQKKIRGRPGARIGLIILIILVSIFFIRVIGVLKDNKERGAFVYVQLLNIGLPIVESEVYDEGSYAENKLSISNVCFDAVGLKDMTYQKILSKELSILRNIDTGNTNYVYEDKGDRNSIFVYNPFTVSEDSISKETAASDITNTQIYNPSLKKPLDDSKPEVLIYHTHTSENYGADCPDSLNEETNVVGAGDVLENELRNNYGISVVHDKTNHCESYNDSYKRSAETVDYYLKEYGDFKIIIDLHRDSVDNKAATTTEIYGMSASRIMFVNAKNSTRYAKNKELTEKIFNKTQELFPGLPRKIYTYNRGINAFNQSKSDGCVLFEIGSHTNTPEESKVTAECMARVIAEILNN
ncbi:stage II sporulation protein P [uncultured Clostridium sp.]|uniref:stage II sporulation protein P n=1 Tax=uncultured Clostridium sp. TaxID=59620 RepID=UPI0025D721BF|nr:stage II sporulation protein P [uncultured Clostridium sp.]